MLKKRDYYKPFQYPWMYELWHKHENAMHWNATEVAMHEDVRDWNTKLTPNERSLITNLFRFFTQGDTDVAKQYVSHFLPYFAGTPECTMMLSSFASREAIHQDAYAVLVETLNMPEDTFKQFHSYKEMLDKHAYLFAFNMSNLYNVLKTIAAVSAFTEGMQLFSSFAILLNFTRFNKMKNMGNIISWSIADEQVHVEGMTRIFKELFPSLSKETQELIKTDIAEIGKKMVSLEDSFIDLCFSSGDVIEGLTKDEVHQYIRHIANIRFNQLGFSSKLFPEVDKNPFPWIDWLVNGQGHTNFFEQKETEYGKALTKGSVEDIVW